MRAKNSKQRCPALCLIANSFNFETYNLKYGRTFYQCASIWIICMNTGTILTFFIEINKIIRCTVSLKILLGLYARFALDIKM